MSDECAESGAHRGTGLALAGLAGWIAAEVSLRAAGVATPPTLAAIAHFLAADAFLVAAVLRLFRWRATRDSAQRRHAIALGTASLLFPLTATLEPWTADGVHLTPTGLVARCAIIVAVVPLLAARLPGTARVPALTLLVAAAGLRVVGPLLPGGLDELAPGCGLAAALLFAGAAVADFRAGLQARSRRADELELELATAQARLERSRQVQRARLHDAQSAVVGVLGASAALVDDAAPLTEREALQQLIAAELTRLATVLGVEADEPVGRFDLREALLPVLRLHRLGGPRLMWELAATAAVGRPRATATALDNLLGNAERHAPGAAVRVTTRLRGDEVQILVDDDGPGIPPAERDLVLGRGVRGSGARGAGSGLGLANVAAAMAAQDGRVEVTAAPAGGTRVTLTLPVADRAAVAC